MFKVTMNNYDVTFKPDYLIDDGSGAYRSSVRINITRSWFPGIEPGSWGGWTLRQQGYRVEL